MPFKNTKHNVITLINHITMKTQVSYKDRLSKLNLDLDSFFLVALNDNDFPVIDINSVLQNPLKYTYHIR